MIQIYADGSIVYDSRLDGYEILGCVVTSCLNKGGVAEITLPPSHPHYSTFVSYKTLVEIYRDDDLKFRGRALYPTDDWAGRRKITCEGELCFLRDSVILPYVYQDTPANIFTALITEHNSQADSFKEFVVGSVTVTDPNDYIRLESEYPKTTLEVIEDLIDRCGGYITFATVETDRTISWVESLSAASTQQIRLGSNLMNIVRSDENTDLATRIYPLGAKNGDGVRLTIEAVNGDVAYIEDATAVTLRGVISKAVLWDDVTVAANLLTKAQAYLAASKLMITSLEVSAVDLSLADSSIDIFELGDLVTVVSEEHDLSDAFLLTSRTEDLLDPKGSYIELGKDKKSLVGSDVAGDRQSASDLEKTVQVIKANYELNIADAIEEATTTLQSLIQQTSDAITLEVSETYATNGDLTEYVGTQIQQLSDAVTITFTNLTTMVNANNAAANAEFAEIQQYIRFVDGDIILGESGNTITLRIENDKISFLDNGGEVAYFSENKLVVLDANFLSSLQIGNFAFVPRQNGNLSLVKVG